MALIKCKECGNSISDKATTCPHCGCPVENEVSAIKSFNMSEHPVDTTPEFKDSKKKDSTLSIVSCALTFVSCFMFNWLALGGVICGIIDLCMRDKEHKHIGSIFGVVIGFVVLFVWITILRRM